jgi:hypothetical protein
MKGIKAGTMKDDKTYEFTFSFISEASGFDRYLPTIQSMIDSFEITTEPGGREDQTGGGSGNSGFFNGTQGTQEQGIGQPGIDQEGEQESSEDDNSCSGC